MIQDDNILFLPGDGIGPEVVAVAKDIFNEINETLALNLQTQDGLLGGAAIDAEGLPLSENTLAKAQQAKGILMGAVGGPKWDNLPATQRPEKGLLSLRENLDLFANLRPALLYPQLVEASSLKPEFVSGLDLLILRELTGGIYFGEPRGITGEQGERVGFNTDIYSEKEITRIGHLAFQFAQKRNKKLCSVDKANVLEVTMLWREVMTTLSSQYPDVALTHMYVDNAAMQLVKEPKQFDVIVTGNLFGDILSDQAAMLTGSIGMLPSASLNSKNQGLFEACHGSAPDIAGKDIANPLATILSLAMLFRHSLNRQDIAVWIETAVAKVLDRNIRTTDIACKGATIVGTKAMGTAVLEELRHILNAREPS